MYSRNERPLRPRDGLVLVVLIVALISGCANQKELSLRDQEDHARELVKSLYDGPARFIVVATKGKGERLDRPELEEIEQHLRSRQIDLFVLEDLGRLVRGEEAKRLLGAAVDAKTRCICPNDGIDTNHPNWRKMPFPLVATTLPIVTIPRGELNLRA